MLFKFTSAAVKDDTELDFLRNEVFEAHQDFQLQLLELQAQLKDIADKVNRLMMILHDFEETGH